MLFLTLTHNYSLAEKKEPDVLLWEQGRSEYLKGNVESSLNFLEKLIHHYPSSSFSTEAFMLIALSYQKLKKNEKALKPLKTYILRKKTTPEGLQARILLIRIYLELKLYSEASLLSQEVLTLYHEKKASRNLYLEALVVKAQSELGLKNIKKAQISLQDFFKETGINSDFFFIPEAAFIQMKIKNIECNELKNKKPADEGAWIVQMKEIGNCILEELNLYQRILRAFNPFWTSKSTEWVIDVWREYKKNCGKVSFPTSYSLNPDQKKEFIRETLPLVKKQCREILNTAQISLEKWKKELFDNNSPHIDKILQEIGKGTL